MKKYPLIQKIQFLVVAGLLAGCSTMHFDNGPESQASGQGQYESWHHVGVLDLVEFSDPLDLSGQCKGWNSAKVEMNPAQVVVSVFVGAFYRPWDVQVTCKK